MLTVTFSANAQDFSQTIEARYGYGFLLAHRANMRHLLKGHASMLEINVNLNRHGYDHLSEYYKGTKTGFTIAYIDAGNKEHIGFSIGAYPHIRFDLGKAKHAPKLQLGAGIGLVQKPFNQETNVHNIAIGSYLNALINISLEDEFVFKRNIIKYGFSFTHFSNGAYSAPNLGLNIPMFYVGYGIGQYPAGDCAPQQKFQADEYIWARNHEAYGVLGFREISLHRPKKYMVGSISYQYLHQFSNKLAWSTGVDVFQNSSLGATYTEQAPEGVNSQIGCFAGLEVLFNQRSLFVEQGVYAFSPFKGNGLMYNRIGFRNRFDSGIILNISLKTHLEVAEYVEFGIGYRFKSNLKSDELE